MKQERHTWNSGMFKKARSGICLAALTALLLSSVSMRAQSKSIGGSFSFTGISFSYEHRLPKDNSFIAVELKAENNEMEFGRSNHPGVSASATWNVVIKEWMSSENNAISLFAGPGAIIGYGADFKTADGAFFGLKGRVGIECSFSRNVIISACMTPILGSHITISNDSMRMTYYKNGLLYALVPEIGVKYRF